MGEANTEFIKHILFGNFWSFLLILAGIVDIGIGVLSYFSGILAVRDSPLSTFLICLIVGSIYFAAGLAVAVVKYKKRKHTS